MITVMVAILIMRLADRYASADRTDADTNFVRCCDSANYGGNNNDFLISHPPV
jgi:hypothetical protein